MQFPHAGTAVVALVLGALACAGLPSADATQPQPISGQFVLVEVAFGGTGGAFDLEPASANHLRATVRQSALDWLENAGRLSDHGTLELRVSVDSLRLRSAIATWLFAWAVAPDHLAASAEVRRDGVTVARYRVRVESGLRGFSWRDPTPRLDRLARRLGRRLAEGL